MFWANSIERLSARTAGSNEFGGSLTAIRNVPAVFVVLWCVTDAVAAAADARPITPTPITPSASMTRTSRRPAAEREKNICTPSLRGIGREAGARAPQEPTRAVHEIEQIVEYTDKHSGAQPVPGQLRRSLGHGCWSGRRRPFRGAASPREGGAGEGARADRRRCRRVGGTARRRPPTVGHPRQLPDGGR